MYLLCLVLATIVLLFNYASRVVCALAFFTLTALFWALQTSHGLLFYVPAGIVLCVLLFCYAGAWRRRLLMRGVYQHWRDSVPDLSDTEREVLDAGVTGWEQEFFNGRPNWQKLETCPWGQLTAEEEAFLTGPVEALCALYDPWTMGALKRDIPNTVWSFIRDHGFLGMIIPKEWGGLGFSALAHSAVIAKIGSYDPSLATAIGVPNSLGPAELLLHYGTEAQKKSLLPRLAKGQEIPCFALTSPVAGSDAGSIIDQGVVCQGDYQGRSVLGVRLNWDKRYITLSPVATLLGLAFKLYDPDHLLGEEENLGITLALVPTNLPGIHIGRHHFPLHTAFPNGPTQGEDVFIPMDQIIGGQDCIGMGWKMLMECLAAGRCISLPGVATGAASLMTPVSVSYACLREQFGRSIAAFEGVQASLVEAIADTYVCEAMRQFSASAVDAGQQSAVASAICKYHATEMGRSIVNHLMDVHGGKGICLGPSNYLGRMYDCVPICITVEGANILTRNLIIFGQGLMRLHPFARAEIETAHRPDINAGLKAFDRLAMQHIGRFLGHTVRSVVLGFTSGYACWRPSRKDKVIDYAYRHMTRFTAVFGFLTDVAMFSLQSKLKRMENVSARFADVLSDLYILSVVLKQYEKAGAQVSERVVMRQVVYARLYHIQQQLLALLNNFPIRWLGRLCRVLVFPLGARLSPPKDRWQRDVVAALSTMTPLRHRLLGNVYTTPTDYNAAGKTLAAFDQWLAAEPLLAKLKAAIRDKTIPKQVSITEQLSAALEKNIFTVSECDIIRSVELARSAAIAVDDFSIELLQKDSPQIKKSVEDA